MTGLTAEELVLKAQNTSVNAVVGSAYWIEPADRPTSAISIDQLEEATWTPVQQERIDLGNIDEDVWLRIDFALASEEAEKFERILWTRNRWLEIAPRGFCRDAPDGPALPIRFTTYGKDPDAFLMQLPADRCRVFVRVHTYLSKLIVLEISGPLDYHAETSFLQALNSVFFTVVLAMIVFNFIFFVSYRSIAALIYVFALIFFICFQGVLFGFGDRIDFVRETIGISRALVLATLLFVIHLILFWKRLLFLSEYAPTANKVMNGFLVYALLSSALCFVPGAPLAFIAGLSKILFFLLVLALLVSAWTALRRGFRPAGFSLIGVTIFTGALALFFSATTLGFFSEFKYVAYIPFTGYTFEAFFFVLSLISRQRLVERVGTGRIIRNARASRSAERGGKYSVSKIEGIDVEDCTRRLDRLMTEEKLFCDEDISLQRLSEELELAPYQLTELLNVHLDRSFFRFINEHRVKEAQSLLLSERERPVASIASAVGFNSKSSFNTEFKKLTGLTPSQFRKAKETEGVQ